MSVRLTCSQVGAVRPAGEIASGESISPPPPQRGELPRALRLAASQPGQILSLRKLSEFHQEAGFQPPWKRTVSLVKTVSLHSVDFHVFQAEIKIIKVQTVKNAKEC
jgi:hypothetical protein